MKILLLTLALIIAPTSLKAEQSDPLLRQAKNFCDMTIKMSEYSIAMRQAGYTKVEAFEDARNMIKEAGVPDSDLVNKAAIVMVEAINLTYSLDEKYLKKFKEIITSDLTYNTCLRETKTKLKRGLENASRRTSI